MPTQFTPEQFIDNFLNVYHRFLAGELITEVFGYDSQMPIITTTRRSDTDIQLFFIGAAHVLDNRLNDMKNITQEEKDRIIRCYHSAVIDMFTTQLHELFKVLDNVTGKAQQKKQLETEGIFKNLDFEMPPYNPNDLDLI